VSQVKGGENMDEEILAAEEAIETSNGNEGEVNTQEESQPTEQTTGETSTEASETVETVEKPKKGAQSRIKELNSEVKSLKEKLAELTSPVGLQTDYQPQFNPTEPIVADGEEISVQELNQRIAQRDQRLLQQASANSELRIKQTEAVNRINSEAINVVRKYPQLDPENENFDQELSDSITEATEAYVKSAPYSASVSQFVDKLMKPYTRAVEKEVGKATANIAKQVTEAALRPTSIQKGEKTANELSIAELEAKLGVVNS
jgi:flagellar biosynthesis chaperone FliJ